MQVPLELTYNEVPRIGWIDDYVKERVDRLDRMCDDIIACRVAIEREQHSKHKGNPYRARVEITLPQKKDLVAHKHGTVENLDVQLRPIIRQTFEAVEKQLNKEMQRRRGNVKHHEEPQALVVRLFPEQDYGFIKSPVDGEEYFFHRNAVLHGDFDRLEPGTQVRFEPEMGEQGPQASTVQIIGKPGVSADQDEEDTLERPVGWEKH
jgi:cold shock CspA family protein